MGDSRTAGKENTMNKDTTNELLVVQDMTSYTEKLAEGYLTQEEFDITFGEQLRNGKLFNTPDGEVFLAEYGDSIPFFMGGSNAGVVEGHSKYQSRRFLQLEKLGLIEKSVLPSLQFIYDYGHYFEDAIGRLCAGQMRRKGIDVVYVPCDYGYINTRWPSFLAHPDGFLLDRKSMKIAALAEVKTSLKKGAAWRDDFSNGIVPEEYIDQVQAYMQVLGLDDCYVLAHSKHADSAEDFVQIHVARDEARAVRILDDCERFVRETAAGVEYDDEILPDEVPVLYKEVDEKLGYVRLPRKTQGTLEQIERLTKDRESLKEAISDTSKLIARIDSDINKLRASLIPAIGKAPGGMLETSKAVYRIDVNRSFSLDKDVKQKAAEEFPEVWKAICGYKPTVTCTVKVTEKETEKEQAQEEAG